MDLHPHCTACGHRLPVALLVFRDPFDEHKETTFNLEPRDYTVGRSASCTLQIGEDLPGVSRTHALLRWTGRHFEISDSGSTHGTILAGRRLEPDDRVELKDGDEIILGEAPLTYYTVYVGRQPWGRIPYGKYLRLVREMNSLEPATVVARGLDLLRLVSGINRGFLVDAGTDDRLRPLLTPLDDPALRVSRTNIEAALSERRKVVHLLGPDDEFPSGSMASLQLRRVWVSPIVDHEDRPLAAVYLDSETTGVPLDEETENLMDAVADQIGMALRNASLHSEVLALNIGLEQRVAERTRQLRESQDLLVSQDRLATLGRLVAAIAHELNNPVGAMASFAETIEGLLTPLLGLGNAVDSLFPDAGQSTSARRLLDAVLAAAQSGPLDTRARRELAARLTALIRDNGVPAAEETARRLARIGLSPEEVSRAAGLLRERGQSLVPLLEQVHTFGRGVATIRDCSTNVARIVDGLKTYAHLDQADVEEANLSRGIEAALTVLQPRLSEGISIETRFAEVGPFPHRPGELTQVWTNLIDNAVRAMGEEGTIVIETRDLGDDVQVTVQDNGPGIPQEMKEKIFDLHTTTRGPGAGLGLGLPICRAIVEKNHGGRLSFESRPGRTVFTVTLPKVPPEAEE